MTYYFIKEGDKELGPFTFKHLKSKPIQKDTLVWFVGLQEWAAAGQVHELKELFTPKAPSGSFLKIKIHKFWDHKLLKQQIKKVSYHLILLRARKNLY